MVERVYWDTSCFISFLSATHPDEKERALICRDVLQHAINDRIEVWTSAWSIVETIRPKTKYVPKPLPLWARALEQTNDKGIKLYPDATAKFEEIWEYYNRHTVPTRKLSDEEYQCIRDVFSNRMVRMIQVEPSIAEEAARLAIDRNIRPADGLHVASALARKCAKIHCWDHDYSRTDDLIPSGPPTWMSEQPELGLSPPPPSAAKSLGPPTA
jgi:predicted nucleic acid-binding protein